MNEVQKYLGQKERENEQMCRHCGACCGAYDGDPCQNLRLTGSGQSKCCDYQNRLGSQRTVSGNKIKCVLIKEILQTHWVGDHLCGYKR